MSEQPEVSQVMVRRAPKYPAFLVVGGALGAIATLILTSLYKVDPAVGFTATFAYFCLFGIPAGLVIGAVLAIILDRRSTKRARPADVEVERGE